MSVNRTRDPGKHRESLVELIRESGAREIVEVGVYKCVTSMAVLMNCDVDRYYMVDPWCNYWDSGAGEADRGSPKDIDWEVLYEAALEVGNRFAAAEVLRLPSVSAAMTYIPGELDLVFIDGDHSYEGVKADIEAWLPKVRRGGILAGHDYYTRWPGVVRAVDEAFEDLEFMPDTVWWTQL